jgi:hypothetical protein
MRSFIFILGSLILTSLGCDIFDSNSESDPVEGNIVIRVFDYQPYTSSELYAIPHMPLQLDIMRYDESNDSFIVIDEAFTDSQGFLNPLLDSEELYKISPKPSDKIATTNEYSVLVNQTTWSDSIDLEVDFAWHLNQHNFYSEIDSAYDAHYSAFLFYNTGIEDELLITLDLEELPEWIFVQLSTNEFPPLVGSLQTHSFAYAINNSMMLEDVELPFELPVIVHHQFYQEILTIHLDYHVEDGLEGDHVFNDNSLDAFESLKEILTALPLYFSNHKE